MDAVKCVVQVDEETGLNTQSARSDVAGCDEDLFTDEAREELLSESLSEETVVRIVGPKKRWDLNLATGRLFGPGNLTVLAKEERARVKVDKNEVLSRDG